MTEIIALTMLVLSMIGALASFFPHNRPKQKKLGIIYDCMTNPAVSISFFALGMFVLHVFVL